MARTKAPYWLCRGCGHRNERRAQKCRGEGCKRSRPKSRRPQHERIPLGEMTKQDYAVLNRTVHGVDDNECALCGLPVKEGSYLQRDHAHHDGGYARGLIHALCNKRLSELEYHQRGEPTETWLLLCYAYLRRSREHHEQEVSP